MNSKNPLMLAVSGPVGDNSIRTTISLTAGMFDLVDWMATRTGLSFKDVYEGAMDNLHGAGVAARVNFLTKVRALFEEDPLRLRRCVVISSRTKEGFELIAKQNDVSRDEVIGAALMLAHEELFAHLEQLQVGRAKAVKGLKAFYEDGLSIAHEIRTELGGQDPLFRRFQLVLVELQKTWQDFD